MKRVLALLSALAVIGCGGCSDKNKAEDSSSGESSAVSGEISGSGEAVEDIAPAVTEKAGDNSSKVSKDGKGSGEKDPAQKDSSAADGGSGENGYSPEGTGSFKPDKFLEAADFADVQMNLNIADADSASSIQKLEVDFAEFGEGTAGNAAYDGEALWVFFMVPQGAKLIRHDIASGKTECICEYKVEDGNIPVDVYFGGGKLLCNTMSDMEYGGIAEIDPATGSLTRICGSECGYLTYSCDDTVTLLDVDWDTQSGNYNDQIPAKVYSLDPSTGNTELLFDGMYDEWCIDYPGKTARKTTETDVNNELVKTTLETDTYKITPPDNCQLAGATSECVSFLEYVPYSSDVTKRIHTYDIRTREHLIINATNIPEMYHAAGNNLVCYDPRGMIKTVYCVCPRIGTAFRLDGLSFLQSTPVISVTGGKAAVGSFTDMVGGSTVGVYYIIG